MNDITIDKTGWKKWRFDEFAQNISERVEPSQTDMDVYVGLEHIDPDTLHLSRHGHPSDVEGTKLRFYKGDIIFGRRRAYQRKTALATTDGICSAHAMVLRAKEDVVDPSFFPFLFHSKQFIDMAITISVGGLSPTINWKDISKQEFLLPPKSEQKRLAELLWAADEMIEKETQTLKLIEKLYSSSISSVFNNQSKYCDLGSLCNIKSGFAFPLKYQGHKDLSIPFFKVSDMNNINNKYEMQVSENYIDESILKSIRGQVFPIGSLVFPKIGATIHTDKKRLLSIESVVDNNIMVLVPNKELLNPYFLFYFFNSFKLSDIINTGAVPTISAETVRNIQIPELDIEEQKNIVRKIGSIVITMKQQEQQIEQSQQVKLVLINKIF
jgi:restriction endonuclease S subunit